MWNFKSSIISLLPTTIQRPLPMSEKGGGGDKALKEKKCVPYSPLKASKFTLLHTPIRKRPVRIATI